MPSQPAILGTARLGNTRLGYRPAALTVVRATRARITLAGAEGRVRKAGLTITDALNDAPNTCGLTVEDPEPVGQERLRVSINSDAPRNLFAGNLQDTELSYAGDPPLPEWPSTAIDDTGDANRRRPFGTWTEVSATTIGIYLAGVAGMSAAGIQAGLPDVSVILDGSEGINGAFGQLATLIGGFFKFEDGVAFLFQDEPTDPPDDIDDTPGRFFAEPPIRMRLDFSQLLTRAFGKGHAEAILASVLTGETIIPVVNADAWFSAAGGQAIALWQRFAYTGIQAGGGGSMVGPGASPSVAPVLALAAGASLGVGVYKYGYTDVTPAGESAVSPLGTITTENTAAPTDTPVVTDGGPFAGQGPTAGGSYRYGATIMNNAGTVETGLGPLATYAPSVTHLANIQFCTITTAMIGRRINFYRSDNGASPFVLIGQVGPVVSGDVGGTAGWTDGSSSVSGGSGPLNNAQQQGVTVTGIAIGAGATTARKVYRTAVGASQLKLLTTIADNTTLTFNDATADGSLGANAPTDDTSLLEQSAGQVLAGVTSIPFASAATYSSTGGWVLLGSQAIRYTGRTSNTLTGIPATGPGALLNTVRFGEHGDVPPCLTGVTGIDVPILQGTAIAIWVQREDLTAQSDQAVIDAANGRTPADGIYEGPPIVDERRNEASLTALVDATLQLRSRPIQTVTYVCPDVKSKSGKKVHIDVTLTSGVHVGPVDLTIQSVTITDIDQIDGVPPRFAVTASSVAGISLDGLLRKLLSAVAAR